MLQWKSAVILIKAYVNHNLYILLHSDGNSAVKVNSETICFVIKMNN